MRGSLRIVFFTLLLLAQGCSPDKENASGEPKSKIKEAVKEVVTEDFRVYEAARQSLNQSAEKRKAQLETLDNEVKSETQ
jgi:hypothetical protein